MYRLGYLLNSLLQYFDQDYGVTLHSGLILIMIGAVYYLKSTPNHRFLLSLTAFFGNHSHIESIRYCYCETKIKSRCISRFSRCSLVGSVLAY